MHNKPLPIGYVEIQRSWVDYVEVYPIANLLEELKQQAAREHAGLVLYGSRIEKTVDGAGVVHYTLYAGFAPGMPSSEPLDPRNLNAADKAEQIGDPVRDNAIGSREQKF